MEVAIADLADHLLNAGVPKNDIPFGCGKDDGFELAHPRTQACSRPVAYNSCALEREHTQTKTDNYDLRWGVHTRVV